MSLILLNLNNIKNKFFFFTTLNFLLKNIRKIMLFVINIFYFFFSFSLSYLLSYFICLCFILISIFFDIFLNTVIINLAEFTNILNNILQFLIIYFKYCFIFFLLILRVLLSIFIFLVLFLFYLIFMPFYYILINIFNIYIYYYDFDIDTYLDIIHNNNVTNFNSIFFEKLNSRNKPFGDATEVYFLKEKQVALTLQEYCHINFTNYFVSKYQNNEISLEEYNDYMRLMDYYVQIFADHLRFKYKNFDLYDLKLKCEYQSEILCLSFFEDLAIFDDKFKTLIEKMKYNPGEIYIKKNAEIIEYTIKNIPEDKKVITLGPLELKLIKLFGEDLEAMSQYVSTLMSIIWNYMLPCNNCVALPVNNTALAKSNYVSFLSNFDLNSLQNMQIIFIKKETIDVELLKFIKDAEAATLTIEELEDIIALMCSSVDTAVLSYNDILTICKYINGSTELTRSKQIYLQQLLVRTDFMIRHK